MTSDIKEQENKDSMGESILGNGDVVAQEVAPDAVSDQELEDMFKAGVHFGYSRSRRHPKMEPYIFGLRHNTEVFDLLKVRVKLSEASAYIAELAKKNKTLLFVGTKPSIRDIVEEHAKKINSPYMSDRWIGGLLTNFSVIRKRMDYFENIKRDKASGELGKKYTKKEVLMITKELDRLEHNFRGAVSLKKIPDAIFIIDPKEEKTALREAQKMRLPVIAVVNTDTDPTGIQYIIPANDSARSSVHYLLGRVVATWQENVGQSKEL